MAPSRQQLRFQRDVPVCVVWRELGFSEVVAVGAAGEGDEGRGLDAFSYSEAGKEVPPFFQVLDEILGGGEEGFHGKGRADFFFQCSFGVPAEDVFRRFSLPRFDEAPEEVVVVVIDHGVAEAFIYGLGVREFCAGLYGEDAFGDDRAAVPAVERTAKGIDLVFPEVGGGGERPCHVAVEGSVANGEFCFVCVACEDAAEGRGEGGKDPGAPVPGLDIFLHEGRKMERLIFLASRNGQSIKGCYSFIHEMADGDGDVGGVQVVRQGFCQIFGGFRVEAGGGVHEEDAVFGEDGAVEGGIHSRVDAAGDADHDLLHMDGG